MDGKKLSKKSQNGVTKVTGHVQIYDVAFLLCVISFVATLSQCELTINFSFNKKRYYYLVASFD